VAKPELGTKRLCGSCGAKFYDLNKSPIVCPKCEATFEVVAPVAPRGRGSEAMAAAAAAHAPSPEAKTELPQPAEVELVSLEEADAEAEGKKAMAEGDDDIEIEETDEAPFIEEEEEGNDDVSDIIGEGREDEEET
jgi:uncharacterized protein (TIGR02300 family)